MEKIWKDIGKLPHSPSFHGATVASGPGPPPYRGFTVTLRNTTLGKTLLDE
jgi:hypothetical protein